MPRNAQTKSNIPTQLPRLFGRGGRDRVLLCLAVNGPMHVRDIARTLDIDPHKTWDMVERLRESGLIVKRDNPGGRKYAALNRDLWVHDSLERLLLALDAHWPVPRVPRRIARWNMPFDTHITSERLDHIFQSPGRSRILLFVAATGIVNMRTIYDVLGLGSVSAMYVVNYWEQEGVFKTMSVGRHRLVALNEKFVVARELRAFLSALIQNSSEYRALRKVGRQHMRRANVF